MNTAHHSIRTHWLGLMVALLVLTSTSTQATAPNTSIPTPKGWTLVFGDDFHGKAGTLPSSDKWAFDEGHSYPNGPVNWGTHEIERYTKDPANIQLDGQGHLLITPRRDNKTGEWTSARIETHRSDFLAPKGGMLRIEARIQMPDVTSNKALGYWPAFWALGGDFRKTMAWPKVGEFDIMESVNGLNNVWGILHCGVNPGGPCGEPYGIGGHSPCPKSTCTASFHTYTFEWNRAPKNERLRWFVDGQLVNEVSENQLPPDTWHELTHQEGYFLILNVAMGGGFSYAMAGGKPTPTATTEPGHSMKVDYVAVWTRSEGVLERKEMAKVTPDTTTEPLSTLVVGVP